MGSTVAWTVPCHGIVKEWRQISSGVALQKVVELDGAVCSISRVTKRRQLLDAKHVYSPRSVVMLLSLELLQSEDDDLSKYIVVKILRCSRTFPIEEIAFLLSFGKTIDRIHL
jgi:hypothetical protein